MLGAVLMVLSGGMLIAYEALLARYAGAVTEGDLFEPEAGASAPANKEIKGPLNILLVGIDPRKPETRPLSDSVMILHVNEAHDEAYLFSMPRDLRVPIPAFPKAGYAGGTDRLNAAMSHGSAVSGQNPSTEQGFQLLAKTLTEYTGISQFDAGVIINFSGFQKIVDAMGGVDMYIERDVVSEHRRPDGTHRTMKPGGGGYLGPQAEYKKGMRHLNGWQALDYVRQRYPRNGVLDSDYGRQRHQQQFIKAMAKKTLSADVVANPIKLDQVLRAAGKSLIFNGRGNSVVDYAFALSGLRPDSIHMIKLPGEGIEVDGRYQGERFLPVADEFFASLREGTLGTFVLSHPELLNKEK